MPHLHQSDGLNFRSGGFGGHVRGLRLEELLYRASAVPSSVLMLQRRLHRPVADRFSGKAKRVRRYFREAPTGCHPTICRWESETPSGALPADRLRERASRGVPRPRICASLDMDSGAALPARAIFAPHQVGRDRRHAGVGRPRGLRDGLRDGLRTQAAQSDGETAADSDHLCFLVACFKVARLSLETLASARSRNLSRALDQ